MQIDETCNLGDLDARSAIEALAPDMVAVLKVHNEWDKPDMSHLSSTCSINILVEPEVNHSVDTDKVVTEVMLARLGLVEEPLINQDDQNTEEYQLAISNLRTDITDCFEDATSDQVFLGGSIEQSGKKHHVSSLLKDLQPLGKDLQRIAGDIPSDQPIPAHHDLQ